jgi:hypothetical protein
MKNVQSDCRCIVLTNGEGLKPLISSISRFRKIVSWAGQTPVSIRFITTTARNQAANAPPRLGTSG